MGSLIGAAGVLLVWQVWLQARLRWSALGHAHRDFRAAARTLDTSHLWLSRDQGTVFSLSHRRVAGLRIVMLSRYRRDDFDAIVRAGSAPLAIQSYRLSPVHLRVLRRFDLQTFTTTWERTDRVGTLWSGIRSYLRQFITRMVFADVAELNDVAAQIRSAERWAVKHAR
jgi:hypothetical protein